MKGPNAGGERSSRLSGREPEALETRSWTKSRRARERSVSRRRYFLRQDKPWPGNEAQDGKVRPAPTPACWRLDVCLRFFPRRRESRLQLGGCQMAGQKLELASRIVKGVGQLET